MKNKLLTTTVVIIMLFVAVLALCACEKDNTHQGTKTIDISTAEQLLELHNNLGSDFDGVTYKLTNNIDLSGKDWLPLGKSFQDAFCSDFNGNGYSITGVRIFSDTASQERESSSVVGFFGFTNNSQISNLTISVDISFVYDTEITYAGGLIGYAYGNTVLDNITVGGKITAEMQSEEHKDFKIYIGGVLGSSTGSISISNVVNNATVLADRLIGDGPLGGTKTELNRAHTAYVGGVAGYIRTIDLSIKKYGEPADADNIIDTVTNNGDVTVYAERLNGGGVFGSLYNSTKTTNLTVSVETALLFDCVLRANAGGAIGYADRVELTDAVCNAFVFEVARKSTNFQEENKIFNAGGLVGYAANNTLISDSTANTIILLDSGVDFAGGLVGVLSDSGLYDCNVRGRIINKQRSEIFGTTTMYDMQGGVVEYRNGEYVKVEGDTKSERRDWAGIVGKVFGGKLLADNGDNNIGKITAIDVDIEAYYAVLCSKIDRVKAGEKQGDKQLFENYATRVDKDNIIYTAEKIAVADGGNFGTPRAPQQPQE